MRFANRCLHRLDLAVGEGANLDLVGQVDDGDGRALGRGQEDFMSGRAPSDISPRVDIVFRELFGREGHEDMLVELLNEILQPACPIQSCRLRNPFVFPDRPDDRAVILDLDAIDQAGKVYHVEMQTTAEANLRKRMMFV